MVVVVMFVVVRVFVVEVAFVLKVFVALKRVKPTIYLQLHFLSSFQQLFVYIKTGFLCNEISQIC